MPVETVILPVWWLHLAALIAAVGLASALVVWVAPRPAREGPARESWLHRLTRRSGIPDAHARLLFGVLAVLFVMGLVATVAVVWHTVVSVFGHGADGPGLGAGALIAAILGAPFLIWRTIVAQITANQADEALFNQKFHAAAEGLAARRKVTSRVQVMHVRAGETEWETHGPTPPAGAGRLDPGKWEVLTEEADDIVTRAAAIDRLFGLVQERPAEAERVARLLSIYVRELSGEFPPEQSPRARWRKAKYPENGPERSDEEVFEVTGLRPEDADIKTVRAWAGRLTPCRSDIERAAQTLGRLSTIPGVTLPDRSVDLRSANLQGFDLNWPNLEGAWLTDAHLEGALLGDAHLERASLGGAHLEGARLFNAHLEWAWLSGAHVEGAWLNGAHLEEARLDKAHLEGASFRGAHLERAWLAVAHLEGASLDGAHLEGCGGLDTASLRGALLTDMDLTRVPEILQHLAECLGDGSVLLPNWITPGSPDWPAHWSTESLDWDAVTERWTQFKASLSPPVP